MVGKSSKWLCGICLDLKPTPDMFRGGKCNHPFCTDCISKHVAAQIQQNILMVNCPNPNCYMELKPEYMQHILPKEVIVRWESAKYESSIALLQKIYCPFKDCSILLVDDGDGGNVVTSSECPYCHRLFCAQCKVPWHAGKNCKEFLEMKRRKGEKDLDTEFLELAKTEMWQKCPKCSIYVQRHSGCEHMTCRCGCNFCYQCGKNWKFGHLCHNLPAPRRSPSYSPRRSPSYSSYRRSSSRSPYSSYRSSSHFNSPDYHQRRSYSPHHSQHRSYSLYYSRHRSYSQSRSPYRGSHVSFLDKSYSPYDSRYDSPDDLYYRPRRNYSWSVTPAQRLSSRRSYSQSVSLKSRRSYSRSVTPIQRLSSGRSYSRSVTPVQRFSSRRSYSRSVSPGPRRRSRRSYSRSVSPVQRFSSRRSRRSYSRSVIPIQRLSSRRSYSRSVSCGPRRRSRRSYSRSVTPVQMLSSRRSYSQSVTPMSRRSYSRSVTPVQRFGSRRSYSRSVSRGPRRRSRRSYSRSVTPVQMLSSRRSYSQSDSPRSRRSYSRSVTLDQRFSSRRSYS